MTEKDLMASTYEKPKFTVQKYWRRKMKYATSEPKFTRENDC